MAEKQIHLDIIFTAEDKEKIKEIAKEEGLLPSQWVRRLVLLELKKRGK